MGKKNKKNENIESEDMATDEEMPDIIEPDEPEDETAILKKQNAELVDKLQRNLAEFDNFRKRTIKEKSEMYDIGVTSAIEKMLPVIDNFERALSASPDKNDNMYKGILMIYKQLDAAIRDLGAEPIECIGQPFNPNFHDAVAHEHNDDFDENTIIEELQKGYMYKEKVIRPSMVKVAN